MVPRWISFLFIMLAEHFSAHRSGQIKFLKLQLVKKKLPGNRVILGSGGPATAAEGWGGDRT